MPAVRQRMRGVLGLDAGAPMGEQPAEQAGGLKIDPINRSMPGSVFQAFAG